MRTNEERIADMHKMATDLKREKLHRQTLILSAASVVVCLALVIAVALSISGMNSVSTIGNSPEGMSASLFAGSDTLGFIVVGIVAFLLGASVTVFCFRLKKWQDTKEGHKNN